MARTEGSRDRFWMAPAAEPHIDDDGRRRSATSGKTPPCFEWVGAADDGQRSVSLRTHALESRAQVSLERTASRMMVIASGSELRLCSAPTARTTTCVANNTHNAHKTSRSC